MIQINYIFTGGMGAGSVQEGDLFIRLGNSSNNILLADSGGNVGIGTNNPTRKLHVMGSITTQIDSDSDNFIELKSNSKRCIINRNGQLKLRTENSNPLIINDKQEEVMSALHYESKSKITCSW